VSRKRETILFSRYEAMTKKNHAIRLVTMISKCFTRYLKTYALPFNVLRLNQNKSRCIKFDAM